MALAESADVLPLELFRLWERRTRTCLRARCDPDTPPLFARPLIPDAKYDAAFEEISPPKRSSESEKPQIERLLHRREIDAAELANVVGGGSFFCSFIWPAVRSTTRRMPVSPTNMWCASSVSMKRVVREKRIETRLSRREREQLVLGRRDRLKNVET